jgi:anti-anti-sigma factor
MKAKRAEGTGRRVHTKKGAEAEPRAAQHAVIEVERSGDWMPAEELRKTAIAALETNDETTLNLGGIDHLDASAMQILLALDSEQKSRGQHLHLANTSPRLRQWFELSGAADHFFSNQRNPSE